MPALLRKLVEAHYTKPDILRLAQRYWEDHPDQAQRKGTVFLGLFLESFSNPKTRKVQLSWLKAFAVSIGYERLF